MRQLYQYLFNFSDNAANQEVDELEPHTDTDVFIEDISNRIEHDDGLEEVEPVSAVEPDEPTHQQVGSIQ